MKGPKEGRELPACTRKESSGELKVQALKTSEKKGTRGNSQGRDHRALLDNFVK